MISLWIYVSRACDEARRIACIGRCPTKPMASVSSMRPLIQRCILSSACPTSKFQIGVLLEGHEGVDLRSNSPNLASTALISGGLCKSCLHGSQPGFLAWQSAHRSLPGTVLISSCIARSLRACERLLIIDDICPRFEE